MTSGATPASSGLPRDPPWPVELIFRAGKASLEIAFDDGWRGEIPYELLRVESPSAETKGHGGALPPPPPGKANVGVEGADPVGRYAVRIRFTDGHDTGLYTWSYLRDLADNAATRMADYRARLKQAGLQRA